MLTLGVHTLYRFLHMRKFTTAVKGNSPQPLAEKSYVGIYVPTWLKSVLKREALAARRSLSAQIVFSLEGVHTQPPQS